MPFNHVLAKRVLVFEHHISIDQGSTTCHFHFQYVHSRSALTCLPAFLCTTCVTDTVPSRRQRKCLPSAKAFSYSGIRLFTLLVLHTFERATYIHAWQHWFKNNAFSLHLYKVYIVKSRIPALWQQPSCNRGLPASSAGQLSIGQTERSSLSVVLCPPHFIQASHIGFHIQHRKKGLTQQSAITHSRIPLAWLLSRYTAWSKVHRPP